MGDKEQQGGRSCRRDILRVKERQGDGGTAGDEATDCSVHICHLLTAPDICQNPEMYDFENKVYFFSRL